MTDLDADDEELLGTPKRGVGRPKGSTGLRVGQLSPRALMHSQLVESRVKALDSHLTKNRRERQDARTDEASFKLEDIHSGVTVSWLSQVFGMDPNTVKQRLADCPPMHRRKAGYVYNLAQAAGYLVKPVFDVKKYLKGMKPSELPPQLTKEYWDAALKRQTWEERAGDLWRTARVLEVLSETFQMMKSTMQLWVDDLERTTGLDAAQRKELIALVDSLQNDIHQNLVARQQATRTPSMREEIEIDDPFAEAVAAEEDEDLIG